MLNNQNGILLDTFWSVWLVCHPYLWAPITIGPFAWDSPSLHLLTWCKASRVARVVQNLPANVGVAEGSGLIPGSGRSPGIENGNPLQNSCLDNSMGRGAWWATVHGVTKNQTWLSDWAHRHTHTSWCENVKYFLWRSSKIYKNIQNRIIKPMHPYFFFCTILKQIPVIII